MVEQRFFYVATFRRNQARVGFIVTNLSLPSRAAVRFLQQARDSRTVDQRGQAGGEDDATELLSLPIQRGAAMAECDRLQRVEPVAAVWCCRRRSITGP